MNKQINPCLVCPFGWKDFCSDEKKLDCIEKLKQGKVWWKP